MGGGGKKLVYERFILDLITVYDESGGVSRSFRIGSQERELQTVELSTTRCSYIAIL
jgi:hypothetical protein